MSRISILCVGIEPMLIDFADPAYAAYPGMTARKVQAGLDKDIALLNAEGYDAELCLTDLGDTAGQALRDRLAIKTYACIVIGAGVRLIPQNTPLLETLVNVAHACATEAKFCFNTGPTDTAEAVRRWFPEAR